MFLGLSIWVWLAILVVIALIAFFTVSPAPQDDGTGEPPPGGTA